MSYDPTIGRWTQEDPIGFEGGDANLYRYVGNSPTNATDPMGLQEVPGSKGRHSPQSMLGPFLQKDPIYVIPAPTITAGKEIGSNLLEGLRILEQEYAKLSYDEKLLLAYRLIDPIDGLTAWDIRCLSSNNSRKFGLVGPNDAPDTVTVFGKVHLAPAVNYIAYGRINRLIHDDPIFRRYPTWMEHTSYEEVIGTVKKYRQLKSVRDGFGVDPFVAWAQAGYTGHWGAANNSSYSKPGFNIVPSAIQYQGIMPWVFGASIIDGDFAEGTSGIINFNQGNYCPD